MAIDPSTYYSLNTMGAMYTHQVAMDAAVLAAFFSKAAWLGLGLGLRLGLGLGLLLQGGLVRVRLRLTVGLRVRPSSPRRRP